MAEPQIFVTKSPPLRPGSPDIEGSAPQIIAQNPTFDSSSADEGDKNRTIRRNSSSESEDDDDGIVEDIEVVERQRNPLSKHEAIDCSLFASWEDIASQVFYISTFAILGTVLRAYMGRFFGLDCLQKEYGTQVDDYVAPVSSLLCITSDGKVQRGGALFIDLPSNILGTFFMGIMSPAHDGHPLPWFRSDHPLQRHTALHAGLKVGFCGCLTTFASWNTQMVVMMDGTDTDFGPQVGASFFGYLVGVACPVASFIFGRHIFDWLRSFHPLPQAPSIEDGITAGESEDHAGGAAPNDQQAGRSVLRKLCKIRYIPMVASIGLIFAFAYGDAVKGSLVYRKMWMATLLSPLGSVLRWRLSELNYRKRGWIGFEWLPWGTFAANIVAVMISAFTESLDSHVIDADDAAFDWLSPALQALGVGFAGSLSTMSTLVHEMFFLETPGKANGYCFTSIVCSMLIGLLIYSPIARSG